MNDFEIINLNSGKRYFATCSLSSKDMKTTMKGYDNDSRIVTFYVRDENGTKLFCKATMYPHASKMQNCQETLILKLLNHKNIVC